MRPENIIALLKMGAKDKVRLSLKKMSLDQRLPVLRDLVPYLKQDPSLVEFFRDEFRLELGALSKAKWNLEQAESYYRAAKRGE
jgi:hypothetical protein